MPLVKKTVHIYCDGSSLGNPGWGGYCAILRYQEKETILRGNEENVTNNRMELMGLVKAIERLKEPVLLEVYTDSKYVSDGLNLYLDSWVKKNFSKIKNPELWRMLAHYSKIHSIKVNWVKGHAGHPYNERCDRIAKEEAYKLKRELEERSSDDLF